MTRTICDRCGKIIDKFEHVRTVTLFRPIRPRPEEDSHSTDRCRRDPVPNDVVWQHDLCMDCANEVEKFVETAGSEDVDHGPGTSTPDVPESGGDGA